MTSRAAGKFPDGCVTLLDCLGSFILKAKIRLIEGLILEPLLRAMLEAFGRLCWGPSETLQEYNVGVRIEDFRGPKVAIPIEREAYF